MLLWTVNYMAVDGVSSQNFFSLCVCVCVCVCKKAILLKHRDRTHRKSCPGTMRRDWLYILWSWGGKVQGTFPKIFSFVKQDSPDPGVLANCQAKVVFPSSKALALRRQGVPGETFYSVSLKYQIFSVAKCHITSGLQSLCLFLSLHIRQISKNI